MSGLSSAEQFQLEDLWTREDMAWLPTVEAIVARAISAALTEAADEIDRYADDWSDDIEFVATALTKATTIVRARIPN